MSDSRVGSDEERADELLFKDKVEEISRNVFTSKLSEIKKLIIAFLSGLTLLVGAGFVWKENVLLPVVEYIYIL
ncbi:hypothetical protein ACFSJQ_21255 [Vibrio olivae]|uniref:Uncharacterized protein n=1 Tax=Vibrio olivae TaxID=1243002 RepID=A0ABV5HTZ0_9VIBR